MKFHIRQSSKIESDYDPLVKVSVWDRCEPDIESLVGEVVGSVLTRFLLLNESNNIIC